MICTEYWKIRRISDGKFLSTSAINDFPDFTSLGDRRFRKFSYAVEMCSWLMGKPSTYSHCNGPILEEKICDVEIVKYRETVEEIGCFDPVIPTQITDDML